MEATQEFTKQDECKRPQKKIDNEETIIFDMMKKFFELHPPKKSFLTDIRDVGFPLQRYRINWWIKSESKGAYIALSYYVYVEKKGESYSFVLAPDCINKRPKYYKD